MRHKGHPRVVSPPPTSPPHLGQRAGDVAADFGEFLGRMGFARARDRQVGDHMGGACRQREQTVGKVDRLVDTVGDEEDATDRSRRRRARAIGPMIKPRRTSYASARMVVPPTVLVSAAPILLSSILASSGRAVNSTLPPRPRWCGAGRCKFMPKEGCS
jgi:hypothetical protein